MPKKLKLDLNGLKVNSFVTSLGDRDSKKIMGGGTLTQGADCSRDGGCVLTVVGTCETCDCPTIATCEVCTNTQIAAGCHP